MREYVQQLRNGYLLRRVEVKFDAIGQRYRMKVRKYWIDFYSRKSFNQFSVAYKEVNVFISFETPIVKLNSKLSLDSVIRKLEDFWYDVYDYAVTKAAPDWIIYSESDKFSYEAGEKQDAIDLLGVTNDEFELITQLSPYS